MTLYIDTCIHYACIQQRNKRINAMIEKICYRRKNEMIKMIRGFPFVI